MIATPYAPGTALEPELQLLIDRGILSRAASNDTTQDPDPFVVAAAVATAVHRGQVRPDQAETLTQLLGVRAA